MRSGNPALNEHVFTAELEPASTTMTIEGTATKTLLLLGLLVIVGSITWTQVQANPNAAWGFAMVGIIGGLITAFVTIFKPTAAPISAPIYAAFEGVALGQPLDQLE